MPQLRLSIIGVGLLGGSIGLAAKAAGIDCYIRGYGHRRETLQRALEVGAIDGAASSCKGAARQADLVILCTPVGLFRQVMEELASELSTEAIVTDVGSTKRSVVELAGELLPNPARFVGSHPMAGSEKRGIEFARADLFRGAQCILTPTASIAPDALTEVDKFWQKLGMRTLQMTASEHDRLICEVSHLPHVIAAALVHLASDQALPLSGKGFLDSTRIAGGDGAMWRDILQDNRDNVSACLSQLRRELERVEQMLDPAKSKTLADWLDDAARRRAELLAQKLKEFEA